MFKFKYQKLDFGSRGGKVGGTDEIIDPLGNYHLLHGFDKAHNKWKVEVFNPDTKFNAIYYTN